MTLYQKWKIDNEIDVEANKHYKKHGINNLSAVGGGIIVVPKKRGKIADLIIKYNGTNSIGRVFCSLFPLETDDGKYRHGDIEESASFEDIIEFFSPHIDDDKRSDSDIREALIKDINVLCSDVGMKRANRIVNYVEAAVKNDPNLLKNAAADARMFYKEFKENVKKETKIYNDKVKSRPKATLYDMNFGNKGPIKA